MDLKFKYNDTASFTIPSAGDFMSKVKLFIGLVNWSEPIILSLISFHVISFIYILAFRKNSTMLTLIWILQSNLPSISFPL